MPKRALARGLNAAKGTKKKKKIKFVGVWVFHFVERSVNGAWKDDDDSAGFQGHVK